MADLSQTIAPKSDQLNADDLIGKTLTIRVTKVTRSDTPDQPISIFFEGDNGKPYKPCKSMRRVMVQLWGSNGTSYVGRRMTLYRDEKVKFGGIEVGGIRISHMSDIKEKVTLALTASKANRRPFTVLPLPPEKQTGIDLAVKKAGEEAAAKGVEAYTAWLGSLPPAVKETVRPFHNGFAAIAKAADEANKEPSAPTHPTAEQAGGSSPPPPESPAVPLEIMGVPVENITAHGVLEQIHQMGDQADTFIKENRAAIEAVIARVDDGDSRKLKQRIAA